ncbi:MAG: hypothetical protein PHR77_20485 [Kiritimatiellae bacterium]|jgi:hypothetical protein|nr:hypothetical protein [Kiritimatiellia bacterium]MDD5523235.1 hypothetical protein [Kiritimatiellia bacterium]
MHPIITVKSWAHNVHMTQMHDMMENAIRLFRDVFFWVVVVLLTLIVIGFMF